MADERVQVSMELLKQVMLGSELGKGYIVEYVDPGGLVTVPAAYNGCHLESLFCEVNTLIHYLMFILH